MNIIIREVDTKDADAVMKLSTQLGYEMSNEDTRRQIAAILDSADDKAYVAIADNGVVGWIHVFYTRRIESPSFCEIGGLVVDEHYRNNGIGKKLTDHAIPWCVSKGCNVLKVRSNVKRNEAHHFYIKSGFAEKKQQKVFEITLY